MLVNHTIWWLRWLQTCSGNFKALKPGNVIKRNILSFFIRQNSFILKRIIFVDYYYLLLSISLFIIIIFFFFQILETGKEPCCYWWTFKQHLSDPEFPKTLSPQVWTKKNYCVKSIHIRENMEHKKPLIWTLFTQ